MQTLRLYVFSKRRNSTKLPTNVSYTTVQGILKEPCSIINPVFKLQRYGSASRPTMNTYCLWVDPVKYYFVEDWVWVDGLWEVHLREDVLATMRKQIGNMEEYILRTDSTTNFNGHITDTLYPATTEIVSESYSLSNIFTTDLSVGCYIVGIISGGNSQSVGAISYFAMTSAEFSALKNTLFSDTNLEIMGIIDSGGASMVTDLSQEVLKTMYNPYQYIVSCYWFPFGKDAITSTAVSSIKIGWWEYNLSGNRLYAQTFELGNEQFTITAHPQATRGDYLNYAPYTRRTLIGRFGTVPIDTAFFHVGDIINISYMVDLITGQCYAKISRRTTGTTPAEDLIAERNFLLGVPIQLAQVGTDYLGTAVSAINTIPQITGGAVNGFLSGKGAVMGAISGAASGIYNTLQCAMPQVESGGQNGSFLAPANNTHVLEQFYKIADEDISHKGRPLCQTKRIDTLSGFILCADGDIKISAYDNERDEIRNYLTTGFYWE